MEGILWFVGMGVVYLVFNSIIVIILHIVSSYPLILLIPIIVFIVNRSVSRKIKEVGWLINICIVLYGADKLIDYLRNMPDKKFSSLLDIFGFIVMGCVGIYFFTREKLPKIKEPKKVEIKEPTKVEKLKEAEQINKRDLSKFTINTSFPPAHFYNYSDDYGFLNKYKYWITAIVIIIIISCCWLLFKTS